MMGIQVVPEQLFYDFCLEDHVPGDNMLRRIDDFLDLDDIGRELKPFYCTIGRPSVDPALMTKNAIATSTSIKKPEKPSRTPIKTSANVEIGLTAGTQRLLLS